MTERVLLLACGALSHELVALKRANGWHQVRIQCLPADLHNRPQDIPAAVREALIGTIDRYEQVFVAYADCGTGGLLDPVLESFGVERLPGPHCYSFFAGQERFQALAEAEPGTFYLTDFLVRHFDRLVWRGLGLDRHPQLRDDLFAHYRRVVYLAQQEDAELDRQAEAQAARLGLAYERHWTGLDPLALTLEANASTWQH